MEEFDIADLRNLRHVRVGLGLPPGTSRPRHGGATQGSAAIPGDQEGSRRTGHPVLRDARSGPGVRPGNSRTDSDRDGGAQAEQPPAAAYERVVAISPAWVSTVYDLTTSTGNFLVDGMLVHNCDTSMFRPLSGEERVMFRRRLGIPEDAFVVTVVAANKGTDPARKAWGEHFDAFATFRKRCASNY